MKSSPLRKIPAIHQLVEHPGLADVIDIYGREAVVHATRTVVAHARDDIRRSGRLAADEELVEKIRKELSRHPTLFSAVINATGVLLHTNLGRAPIPDAAWRAMRTALHYCDLEMDLKTGARASRTRDVEAPLTEICKAEAGLIVNNNAAAVLLCVAGLAGKKPTAISRGHLVEIGGGFRLPTIMEASQSALLEVGTTNRTHLQDYEEALEAGAGLVLVVHRSNFVMQGYVSDPEELEIIGLAHAYGVPVALDLGSGALVDTSAYRLPPELTVPHAVAAGYDVICFSGDKLLGGPQAGYIVGKAAFVSKLEKHPLARALRCDKIQLAGCIATLELYRRGLAKKELPLLRMLALPLETLRATAEAWKVRLGVGDVVDTFDAVGGGSLPEAKLQGVALAIAAPDPNALLYRLRSQDPPVIGHIQADRVCLHPRTVKEDQQEALLASVAEALCDD